MFPILRQKLLVEICQFDWITLELFSVISYEAIEFSFHISCLGDDSSYIAMT